MKKLLSVLLAVIMIFSCCTLAVNALHLETITEVSYLNNVKETEKDKATGKKVSKTDIINALGFNPDNLDGNGYIEALIKLYPYSETGYEQVLDNNNDAVLDMFGNPVYSKTTVNNQFAVLGIPLDLIYGERVTFLWDYLTAHPDEYVASSNYQSLPAEQQQIITDISKSDINLLVANINMLMLRMLKSAFSGYKFYTDVNAVSLINFVGKLLDADFQPLAEGTVVFNEKEYDRYVDIAGEKNPVNSADEEIFFERVSDLSGLSSRIQANWINYGATRANYKVLLRLLGVTEGTLLESEYMSGTKIGAAILSCAYTRIMGEGPINYFLSVFKPLVKQYNTVYLTPIKLLFTQKINAARMTDEEFATIHGLLNLMFNNNDENNGYQFVPMPEDRLATADSDSSEFNLIMLVYFNINTFYRENNEVIDKLLKSLKKFSKYNGCESYANEIEDVIDCLTDNIGFTFYEFSDLLVDNIESKPGELVGNIKESIDKMINRIIDWFRMWFDIILGNREFGQ